jgi:hypothetical protein
MKGKFGILYFKLFFPSLSIVTESRGVIEFKLTARLLSGKYDCIAIARLQVRILNKHFFFRCPYFFNYMQHLWMNHFCTFLCLFF